jgi:hypothetical protein
MDELIRNYREALVNLPGGAKIAALVAIGLMVVAYCVWRMLRRKPAKAVVPPLLPIDVSMMGDHGPPKGPPVLEFYNYPMRLAAVVLAPVGRVRDLPPDDQLSKLLEAIVPGLERVAALHRPLVRRWPNQVSVRGFGHTLFAELRLPGDCGKGTPWSAVAGTFKMQGQPIMAGLVLRAAASNSFGQMIIDSEEKWLGCLRVKQRDD